MVSCRFEGRTFVMEDYNRRPPFSGFLPGVAGTRGCPVWCLYVNRGQCVASFGEDGREGAMMEYEPAVIAYENTARKGFRTFIDTGGHKFEPFSPYDRSQRQELRLSCSKLEIICRHAPSGLEIHVEYAVLPEAGTGALMRRLTVFNRARRLVAIRFADGMARVIPGGIRNSEMLGMANLTKSFFEVHQTQTGMAVFSSRASTDNSELVRAVSRRHFYFASLGGVPLPVVCDPAELFGPDTGLAYPERFFSGETASAGPVSDCIPCAMAVGESRLEPGQKLEVCSFAGFFDEGFDMEPLCRRFRDTDWCGRKFRRASAIIDGLADLLRLKTSDALFDAYIGQSMLDNILRGGKPEFLGDRMLHVFGRRHGDLERDYNDFALEASHFSEGDGNFRDVCQNRRSDVLFWPEVGKREISEFMELLQLDGYGPLEIHPGLLILRPELKGECSALLGRGADDVLPWLERGLSAGELWRRLHLAGLEADTLMEKLLPLCASRPHSEFKDGYWIDHWTYIPDLIDSFLKIYPERQHELLFETPVGSPPIRARLRRFRERVHAAPSGLRQYGAVYTDGTESACGENMSIFAKLLLLAALKCATFDPRQAGIEMEAGKPGWNDALNGLPGLFGSSASECVDLWLLLGRLAVWNTEERPALPAAVCEFISRLSTLARDCSCCREPSLKFWRGALGLREAWRESVYGGNADMSAQAMARGEISEIIDTLLSLVENGLARAVNASGMLDTYFINQPVFRAGCAGYGENDVEDFVCRPLPAFLEGQAKLMRLPGTDTAALHRAVECSSLFDPKLKMYRLCAPLGGESLELGRIRAFTPGIFERESIFLHAELKYMLALFDAGEYGAFFERLKTVLPPFFNPEVYGRSTLENSSYIVSSAHPDARLHGRGFQPRLSGANAEVLSIWQRMFLGNRMFTVEGGELCFSPAPVLPGWLFDDSGRLGFRYLGCDFSYLNSSRRDTYGEKCAQVLRVTAGGETVPGGILRGPAAERLREGRLPQITIEYA